MKGIILDYKNELIDELKFIQLSIEAVNDISCKYYIYIVQLYFFI